MECANQQCRKTFNPTKSQPQQKFCTTECRAAVSHAKHRGLSSKINTGTTGAMGEILVTYDLMQRGYEVFRSISPTGSCDLLAMKEKAIIRVEVTKGHRYVNALRFPAHDPARYDLLAVWENNGNIT